MSEQNELTWKGAKLMPRFYDGIAKSLIPGVDGNCQKITKFKFGYGFIDESAAPPEILDIPDDLEDIPNALFEGVPDLTYSDGRILARCRMPQGSVTEPRQYSLTGLYNDSDQLIAVTIDLPSWLVPSDMHTVYSYIDFPHVGDNPPQAFDECENMGV